MSERLIMLDIPGVLYSDRSATRLGASPRLDNASDLRFFDPIALGFIRRLFGLTGARVVVSDMWRTGGHARVLQQLDLQVEGMTPAIHGGHGQEIAAYLARRPALTDFVIFSARPESILPAQRPHLVSIDPAHGLTVDDFKAALELLGVACPSTLYPDSQPSPAVRARLLQLRNLARSAPQPTEAVLALAA